MAGKMEKTTIFLLVFFFLNSFTFIFSATPVGNLLIDDFDDYMPFYDTQNNWGGDWYTWADGGSCYLSITVWPQPKTLLTMTAGGEPIGSSYYLRVTGTKPASIPTISCYPSLGVGTDLRKNMTQTGEAVDLREFLSTGGGIRFWAKGDGSSPYKIILFPKGSGMYIHRDWACYEYTFIPPSTWTQIEIPFSSFTQPFWTEEIYPISQILELMQKLNWTNSTNAEMVFDLSLDYIELYNSPWTPTPVQSPTITPTIEITPTITFTNTFVPVISPTPIEQQEITIKPFLNPININKEKNLKINFKVTQPDVEVLTVKIYTLGFRLIKEIKYEGEQAMQAASFGYMNIETKELKFLAGNIYYFYVETKRKGEIKKSKIDLLIILK